MDLSDALSKHQPKSLQEFLGAFSAKQELNKFLTGAIDGKNVVLLLGQSGGGKTTLCQLAFADKFTVMRLQYDLFEKHTDLERHMSNFLTTKTLMETMCARPKLVFLDDVDVLLVQDRFAQSYLIELFTKYPTVRFVMTSAEEKRVVDIRKKPMITTIRITPPTAGELLMHVVGVLDKEGYEVEEEALLQVIKDCACNVRGVFNALMTQPDDDEEDAQHKYYEDLDTFPLVAGILGRWDNSLQDLEIAISSEPTLMAYMMHENYLPWIIAKGGGPVSKIFDNMRRVNHAFCQVATMEPEVPEHMDLVRSYTVRLAQRDCFAPDKKPLSIPPPQLTFSKAIASNTQGKKLTHLARAKGVSVDNLCMMAEVAFMNGVEVPAPVKSKKKKPAAPAGNPEEFVPYQQVFCKKEHDVYRKETLDEQVMGMEIDDEPSTDASQVVVQKDAISELMAAPAKPKRKPVVRKAKQPAVQ